MKAEKYCGLCGQKIEIEYEPRQPVKVICPNCNAETDWKFYKNGNFDTVSMIKNLSELPRISFQEFENRFEEILDNVEKKKMTYILTSNGKDSLVLCPVDWVEQVEKELGFQRKEVEVSFEIEQDVYDKVQTICKKEGTSIEEVTVAFLYFCANPKNTLFLKDWFEKVKNEK